MQNTNFPSRDSMYCARARHLPAVALGRGGSSPRTAISRVIVLHSAGARLRVSVARHVPAAGDATSVNQKYGGPPCCCARFGRDASIGRDQRKLALERILRGEDDTQRRALPRHDRRGQNREVGRVFADTFGL